jgi:hypothetical protein
MGMRISEMRLAVGRQCEMCCVARAAASAAAAAGGGGGGGRGGGISRIASPRQALSRLQHQSKHSQETLPMCNEWPEVDV